jgi:pimeloyl-ACP methyl ester carboxylesterase
MHAAASPAGSRALPPPRVRFFDVTSADGTRLRAWTNDAEGPTLLLCNGLGTSAYVWPSLSTPDCGVRVISWNHRGTGGSARPADPSAVTMDEHVADAIAVLDSQQIPHTVAMGWSIGVNTAFELAVRHPERITGLVAVAGVPGNTFAAMLEPLLVPRALRKAVAVGLTRALHLSAPLITPVSSRLPWTDVTAGLLRHSGFMLPSAPSAVVKLAVREFLSTPVDWYMNLALHAAEHARVPLSSVDVPTVFVAGRWDVLAGRSDIRSAADRIPRATYVELPGSHFLPMERPQEVHDELLRLLDRVHTDQPGTTHRDATRQG